MEAKGLKMNIGKTKVMVSGKNCGDVERLGKWPCTVCGKGVGSILSNVRDVVDGYTSDAQV